MSPTSSTPFRATVALMFVSCWLSALATAQAGHLGMAIDDVTNRAMVFDTETGAIEGFVAVGPGDVGDCAITPDQSLGFVVDNNGRTWVVDLTAVPPVPASGTNPIFMTNFGVDISVAPGGERLVVCGRGGGVSVIDIATRTEIDNFDLGHDCNAVEVCSNNSVLVVFRSPGAASHRIRRLHLDGAGTITDTGDEHIPLNANVPYNVSCSPDGTIAQVNSNAAVFSLQIPGLAVLNQLDLPSNLAGADSVLSPAGDRIYIRQDATTQLFEYNPATGEFGLLPLWTLNTEFALFGGIDGIALDPRQDRLFVAQNSSVEVYDSTTGANLLSIPAPPGAFLTSLCLPHLEVVFGDGFEAGDLSRWSSVVP